MVASDAKLARYRPNGKLDTAFGNGGSVAIGNPEGVTFSLLDLEVDGEGGVTLIGTGNIGHVELLPPRPYPPDPLHPTFAMVIRYRADGSLDPQFGEDGIVRTDFGIPPPSDLYNGSTVALAAGAVDGAGRVVVAVGSREIRGRCTFRPAMERVDRAIVRLEADGMLDLSFGGGDGIAELPGIDRVADLALDPAGRIVLAAAVPVPCEEGPLTAFFRLGADGAPDPDYGTDLRAMPPQEIALDRLGRLLAMSEPRSTEGGESRSTFWRLRPSGKPDRRFGRGGIATATLPGLEDPFRSESALSSFTVDKKGGILAAGTFSFLDRKSRQAPRYKRIRRRFTAIRLTASGKPDRRFGKGGWVITRFGRRSDAKGAGSMTDAKGRLVLAGTATRPNLKPTGGFALARYLLGR